MNKEHKDTVGRFGKGIGEILVENFSLSTENLEASNFILRQAFDDLVVPHYFEPFVRENIDLNYAIRLRSDTDLNNVRLFKGDGDQDRPSQIISRSS